MNSDFLFGASVDWKLSLFFRKYKTMMGMIKYTIMLWQNPSRPLLYLVSRKWTFKMVMSSHYERKTTFMDMFIVVFKKDPWLETKSQESKITKFNIIKTQKVLARNGFLLSNCLIKSWISQLSYICDSDSVTPIPTTLCNLSKVTIYGNMCVM